MWPQLFSKNIIWMFSIEISGKAVKVCPSFGNLETSVCCISAGLTPWASLEVVPADAGLCSLHAFHVEWTILIAALSWTGSRPTSAWSTFGLVNVCQSKSAVRRSHVSQQHAVHACIQKLTTVTVFVSWRGFHSSLSGLLLCRVTVKLGLLLFGSSPSTDGQTLLNNTIHGGVNLEGLMGVDVTITAVML